MSYVAKPFRFIAALGLVLIGPQSIQAQDYVQYETQYLVALPGEAGDLEEALADHNRRFHSDGAYAANVDYVINGPRSGQYFWIMGPGTWTAWDARPADEAHDSDWRDNVLAHAQNGRVEYWRLIDDLSSTVDAGGQAQPLTRVRFFSVEDPGLFIETQQQIEAVITALDSSRSRSFFARQFAAPDGRNFALVTSFASWSELDQPSPLAGGAFQAKFIELFGVGGWDQFQDAREAAGISTLDEWHQELPELAGSGGND